MNRVELIKRLVEAETETLPLGFEEDPMGFILKKYPGLNNVMEYMMTKEFREFVDAIFVVAPKPTTFKVLLHNGQYFFLQFMGDTYQATVLGKNYYLKSIGEKERCMLAIARLLRYGTPLKTKGPEGGETGAEGGAEAGGLGGETTPTDTGGEETGGEETGGEEAGGEALEESKIVELLLRESIADKKKLTSELTISPDYKTKAGFNPYYSLRDDLRKQIAKQLELNPDEVVFRNTSDPKGIPVIDRKGAYSFQIGIDRNGKVKDTKYFVQAAKSEVTGHYGSEERKDSTASSNINEFLTVYFIIKKPKSSPEEFVQYVKNKSGNTGVKTGDGEDVTYDTLYQMLQRDQTPERDINIGVNNAKAVKEDIGKDGPSISQVYWTPRAKPEGVNQKNPSDVIIKFDDGTYMGYSNKITGKGPDATPKFNTNLSAFASKLGDESQDANLKKLVDDSWKYAAKKVTGKNASKAIKAFDITKEPHSESASRSAFAALAREFAKDKLDFYGEDFYYVYRDRLIEKLGQYWSDPKNLVYLLKTIAFYTYGEIEEGVTEVPYKLLIGSETGSTIKDVSSDEASKLLLTKSTAKNLKDINFVYEGGQSFKMEFYSSLIKSNVSIPLTVRTRASGGWAGKSLYINTPGLKKTPKI